MHVDIGFKTNYFNMIAMQDNSIGEDVMLWVSSKLLEKNITSQVILTKFGWIMEMKVGSIAYVISLLSKVVLDSSGKPKHAEWILVIKKYRTFLNVLFNTSNIVIDDTIVKIVLFLLKANKDVAGLSGLG